MLTLKPNSILLICQILQFLVIALKKEGYVEYISKTILLLQPLPPPPPDYRYTNSLRIKIKYYFTLIVKSADSGLIGLKSIPYTGILTE
jgi:hypothetical protein